MDLLTQYTLEAQGLMNRILAEELEPIKEAAQLVANTIEQDRLLHVIGTGGHSVIGAEEVFYRSGGLVPVNAILDEGLLLAHGAIRSTLIERTPGYGTALLDYHKVSQDDVLIIVNAYGINACTIDCALSARKRGCHTIGITSVSLQKALPEGHPSRHPSQKNLCDLVDVVIDTKVPMGDALMSIPGVSQNAGACSTYLNALTMNLLSLETIRLLAERGIDPPIWQSANSPGGDAANQKHIATYRERVKKL